jgi:hypothetical protein
MTPAPSGSPSPLTSPPEDSSCRPRSPMLEHQGFLGKAPMMDVSPSSGEGDLIVVVSRDEAFGNLNRDILGPPGDGKIIILSDSSEEEEVHEEKASNAAATPSSVVRSRASTASTDDIDSTNKSNTPDWATGGCSSGGDEAGLP